MVTITLNGREIPLEFSTYEMKLMQEQIARMGDALSLISGVNPEDKTDAGFATSPQRLDALAKAIVIMGNAGLELAGEEPDLTEKWVLRALRPKEILYAANACFDAMNEGMQSEIPPKEEDGPVDVTLEEMKKKETKGS